MNKFVILCVLVVLVGGDASVYAKRRRHRRKPASTPLVHRYKYSVDPNHAEEILSGLALRPRLNQQEWQDILDTRHHPARKLANDEGEPAEETTAEPNPEEDTYTVKRGDTLSKIAKRDFGNPRLWNKLWELNPSLTNPHELTAGQILGYYREGAEAPVIRIPVIKLVPGVGFGADLDSDQIIHRTKRNQFRPRKFVIREDEILGKITGTFAPTDSVSFLDEMFVELDSDEVPDADSVYGVVKIERKVSEQTIDGSSASGLLVTLVGEIRITHPGDRLAKAEMIRHFGVMNRGDLLIEMPKVVDFNALNYPPPAMRLRVVVGEIEDTQMFGQGQIIVLDKGAADGVKEGYMFRVFHDTDPSNDSTDTVEPDSNGEVQIVFTSQLSSVGYIVRNKDPIYIGDTLVPAQLYPDAVPPPSKSTSFIELN